MKSGRVSSLLSLRVDVCGFVKGLASRTQKLLQKSKKPQKCSEKKEAQQILGMKLSEQIQTNPKIVEEKEGKFIAFSSLFLCIGGNY